MRTAGAPTSIEEILLPVNASNSVHTEIGHHHVKNLLLALKW